MDHPKRRKIAKMTLQHLCLDEIMWPVLHGMSSAPTVRMAWRRMFETESLNRQ
jgi:hypothetical protein